MQKPNLFEFATKELSQDAFLMWFLESWDDPDIGECSLKFIEAITGMHGLKESMTRLKTHAQVQRIDITCDFWVGDEQHLLVIEDKTGSGEHDNQLNRYTEAIAGWKNEKGEKHQHVHLLYYKTSFLDSAETKRVEEANGYEKTKWSVWDLNRIESFFSEIGNETKSMILNQYVDHVLKIKKDLTEVSDLPIKEWTFRNWEGYFRKELLPAVMKTFAGNYGPDYDGRTYFWGYQGRYVSINHYLNPCAKSATPVNFIPKLDLELFIRPWQEELTATIHPAVSDGEDKNETWKCQSVFLEPLRGLAKDHGGEYFRCLRTKQCIGKFGKKSNKMRTKSYFKSSAELTKYIIDLLLAFHETFEEKVDLDNSIRDYKQIALIKKEDEE